MKTITRIILLSLSLALLSGCQPTKSDDGILKVGIIQIVEHPALDAAREGFIEELASLGYIDGDNLKIDYKNAQGDMNTLNTIAQGFASDNVDMIFAIATPSAQAAANATKDIPILFTAVTDPVVTKLVESMEKPNGNLSGTIDAVSIEKQFEQLVQLSPDSKKIGILYNTSEINSDIQVKQAQEVASKMGLEIITKGVTTSNEIQLALNSIVDNIDALYIPTDNLIASSLPMIIPITNEKQIVVVGSEEAHVQAGALFTDGISYSALGAQTAKMANRIFKGENISLMPVEQLSNTQVSVNLTTAKLLGIEIPADLLEKAQTFE